MNIKDDQLFKLGLAAQLPGLDHAIQHLTERKKEIMIALGYATDAAPASDGQFLLEEKPPVKEKPAPRTIDVTPKKSDKKRTMTAEARKQLSQTMKKLWSGLTPRQRNAKLAKLDRAKKKAREERAKLASA